MISFAKQKTQLQKQPRITLLSVETVVRRHKVGNRSKFDKKNIFSGHLTFSSKPEKEEGELTITNSNVPTNETFQ